MHCLWDTDPDLLPDSTEMGNKCRETVEEVKFKYVVSLLFTPYKILAIEIRWPAGGWEGGAVGMRRPQEMAQPQI